MDSKVYPSPNYSIFHQSFQQCHTSPNYNSHVHLATASLPLNRRSWRLEFQMTLCKLSHTWETWHNSYCSSDITLKCGMSFLSSVQTNWEYRTLPVEIACLHAGCAAQREPPLWRLLITGRGCFGSLSSALSFKAGTETCVTPTQTASADGPVSWFEKQWPSTEHAG